MPTLRQKALAKKVLENPQLMKEGSKGELVESVGYSKPIAEHPKRVLESKGFKEELAKYGLTEKLITTSLVSDIENKPKNRLGEMRLGAEILKMNDREEGGGNKTLVVMISSESAERFKIKTGFEGNEFGYGRGGTDIETTA